MSPLTVERRRALLDEYFSLLPKLERAGDDDPNLAELVGRQADLIFEYQDGFAPVPVSRCPFTDAVAGLAIDAVDLDGLWWNWGAPLRGDDDLPLTHFATSGSLAVGERVMWAPFVARPGPELPYVVPRLLEHESMRAVVSSLRVGSHTGYPVMYFADPVPIDLPRVNMWGASLYFARTSDGWGEFHDADDPSEWDFDLAPWIERGKLLWTAPGDADLELRATVADCAYLGLTGSRQPALISGGVVSRF